MATAHQVVACRLICKPWTDCTRIFRRHTSSACLGQTRPGIAVRQSPVLPKCSRPRWCAPEHLTKISTCAWILQIVPTPLTRLCWWRVCLDEAQMVESSTAKAAEMALKLNRSGLYCQDSTIYPGVFWVSSPKPLSLRNHLGRV